MRTVKRCGRNFWEIMSADEIDRAAHNMAMDLALKYKGRNIVLVAVLEGATRFREKIIQALFTIGEVEPDLKVRVRLDSVSVSSYRGGTTGGEPFLYKDLTYPIKDEIVVFVEDILDSRRTMAFLAGLMAWKQPSELCVCALLDKPDRRDPSVDLSGVVIMTGKQIENYYVFGFGLDDEYGHYRELDCVVTYIPE